MAESILNNTRAQRPVLYYDGECKLCSQSVQFILRHDRQKQFLFESLQSENGKTVLRRFHGTPPDSLVLFYKNQYFIKSEAALRVVKVLGGIWVLFYVFIIIPRFIRDGIYDIIARNRYQWFGRITECRIPSSGNDKQPVKTVDP